MHGTSATAPLAAVLRDTSDDDLVQGLELRNIAGSGIRDFFDLAAALLAEESLHRCLTRLDRRSLAALAHLSETPVPAEQLLSAHDLEPGELRRLHDLFLVHPAPDGVEAWSDVGRHLASWPALGLPDPRGETAAAAAPDPEPTGAADPHAVDSLAAERAFTAAVTVSELLYDLERSPLPLLATGAIGRPSARRLAELLNVDEPTALSVVDIAECSGLLARSNGVLRPAGEHRQWRERAFAERWASIADAWAETHWPHARTRMSEDLGPHGTGLPGWLTWNYPGGRDWLPEETAARLRETELLGITAHATLSRLGAHLLACNIDAAAALLAEALPAPIEQLYLQHDLTAVAPGPLQPAIDARLRTMADVDGHAIASRYRFTKASLTRAMAGGQTAATLLEFLASITLSGIPQPLEYLITETASRHGLLRVGPLPTGDPQAVTYVRSDDPMILRTALIDRNLAALRLRPRDDTTIVSARNSDQVYAALHETHYPAAIENTHGRIVQPKPAAARGDSNSLSAAAPDPRRALIARLRAADLTAPDDTDEAWLARQLETAIRTKSAVTVSVRMPNGTTVDYRLEPMSVTGGRLRARDPLSEIERTLPLSSIAAVSDEERLAGG